MESGLSQLIVNNGVQPKNKVKRHGLVLLWLFLSFPFFLVSMNNYSRFLDLTQSDDDEEKQQEFLVQEYVPLQLIFSRINGFIYGKPQPQPQRMYSRRNNRYYDPSSTQKIVLANRLRLQRIRMNPPGNSLEPLDGPLWLWVSFKFRSTQPQHHGYHFGTPDVDNLLKYLLDAMQRAGYFHNDAQVVAIVASKSYCNAECPEARTMFRLKQIANN